MDVSWTLQTNQTKERKELILGFSKVNRKKKKGEIFLLFLQIKKEQRRTRKNFKKIKANTTDGNMERGEGYVLPQA